MKALILIGHGSRMKGFQAPMKKLARALEREGAFDRVICSYLEITPPSIPDAIAHCFKNGIREIFILPYFVLMGRHIREDIPGILKKEKAKYSSKIVLRLCPYLGYDDRILEVVKRRVTEAK